MNSFYASGGWQMINVELRIDLILDLVDFCQSPSGLNTDLCNLANTSMMNTNNANTPMTIANNPTINSVQHYTPMNYSNNDWIRKYWWVILLIILLLIGGGVYYSKNKKSI